MVIFSVGRVSSILLCPGIIPGVESGNERRYIVTSSPIGWTHTQHDLWLLYLPDYHDEGAQQDVIVDCPCDVFAFVKMRRRLPYWVTQIGTP